MNPRAFCHEPGYTRAVLLTFDFNPLFFERLVLPELWAGGTGDVLVIGDRHRIAEASSRWEDQVRHLGHRYQLTGAATRGTFHPKVILRWGSEGAAVWVGSGNLTAGGWGANRELATAWRVGDGAVDPGSWIADFVDRLAEWCPGGLEHDVLRSLREMPWVERGAVTDVEKPGPLLVSHGRRSLASQLTHRWSGRRFESARILTGSTDTDGAFLRWLHTNFGVTRAEIILEEDRASFDPQRLDELQLAVGVSCHPADKPIHAKLYWLDGPDGSAAIMGSANCSAAGWLQAPDRGGNVEVITVYDQAAGDDFQPLLDLFAAEELKPATLVARDPEDRGSGEDGHLRYPVAGLTWERDSGQLRLSFARPLPDGASVRLELRGWEVSCQAVSADRRRWVADAAEACEERRTVFVDVVLEIDGAVTRQLQWIDDLGELRHASRGRRIVATLENLSRPQSAREQQQLIVELQKIGGALLSDPAAFPDPLARSDEDKEKKNEEEKPAPPIDPEELIRSLEEVAVAAPISLPASLPGLSLTGVMRALFDFAEGHDSENAAADEPEEDPNGDPPKPTHKPRRPVKKPPPEKLRRRLRDQMHQYLDRFRDQGYPESCTASQLVQAAAYPLAVAALGNRGWVDDREAQAWVVKVFDVLFREEFANRRRGLLAAVGARYRQGGQERGFLRIVGDGTLWLALLNGLANLPWKGSNGSFEKALALRSVWSARELLDSTDAGRMRTLVARLAQKRIKASLLPSAPVAARQLDLLEAEIVRKWSGLIETQQQKEILHRSGDLLWRERSGWATALEERPASPGENIQVYLHLRSRSIGVRAAGFYVNVIRAGEQDSEIGGSLDAVRNLWAE